MANRTRPKRPGRWRAITLSVLLHSGIVAAAVYGWFTWKHRPPPPTTLAIEATVVDERALKNLSPPPRVEPAPPVPEPEPEPVPEPPPVEEQGPPKPDPAEIERKREEDRLAKEKQEQERQQREDAERREAEKQAAAKAAAEKAAAEKAAAEKRAAEKKKAEEAAAKKAAAEKAAAEKAAAEKRAAEKKKAEEAAAKKAAEEKARQAREAELRRMLEAEERGNAMRNSDEAARWHAQIVARIQRAWIRPPSAQPGVTCIVAVSQVPGGDVTGVRVTSCSVNDGALRESVEAAVYRASPLPAPPNPALFERNLELTFAPQ